jgi:LuxR family maltose regulon positive regulatory protein
LERLAVWSTEESAPSSAVAHLIQAYTRDLLDAFQQEGSADKSQATEAASPSLLLAKTLIDPLTDRELEVLRLLAEGLSNKTIAGKLIVAPSTVKQHLKHIYGKLDVHSRTQAVARGRELGLL